MRMLVATTLWLVAGPLFAADDTLRYLPSDTKVVFTLHVGRLSESDRKQGQVTMRDAYQKFLCPTLTETDPLPLSDLEQIVLALPYAGTFNGLIVIRGKIDRKRFEQQMNRATKGSRTITWSRMGTPAVPVYRCKLDGRALVELVPGLGKIPPLVRPLVAPQNVLVAALDDRTLVVSLCGVPAMKRALRSRPVKTVPGIPAELAKLLRQEHKADIATLILMDDSLHPGLQLLADEATKETFEQFEYVRFHLRGGTPVAIETVVQGKSSDLGPTLEKKATRVLEVIREHLPTVMADPTRRNIIDSLVKSFRITRNDERVTIAGSMSEVDAKKFVAGEKK